MCDSFFNIPDEAAKGVLELYGTKGSLMAEVEDFIDAVEKNRNPMNSGEEALKNFKIIQAAYLSQKKGKVVRV